MKRTFTGGIVAIWIISLSMLCAGIVIGGEGSMTFVLNYSEEDLVFKEIDSFDLIELKVDKHSLKGKPGEPWMPVCYAHVLIPQDKDVDSVEGTVLSEQPLEKTYYICPAQPDYALNDPNPQFIEPDPVAYSQETAIPEKIVEYKMSGGMRGYHMVSLQVNPVTYIPNTKVVSVRKKIKIVITFKAKTGGLAITEEDPIFRDMVKAEVINPEDAENYFGTGTRNGYSGFDKVKYLIICSQNMASAEIFDDFIGWKAQKGLWCDIKNTTYIANNYQGEDLQEKIRECIKDHVYNFFTTWVFLIGDDPNTIRYCYVAYNPPSDPNLYEEDMPTDLYFTDLDSNWDYNDNGIYGELDDHVDLWPDVIFGRLATEDWQEALAYLNKALDYEKNMPATGFANKMILCGNDLLLYGDAEGKSEYMYLGNPSDPDDNGWIQPYWSGLRYRFYSTDTDFGGPSYDVNNEHMNERINDGYNFLHMATHGMPDYWQMESDDEYSPAQVNLLTNANKYTNILTISCHTNAFDLENEDPCLGEAFIRKANGGAVSYIGCSRGTWGANWSVWEHGMGFKYDREFYHHLFWTGWSGYLNYHYHLGAVYNMMKTYWIGECDTYEDTSMRWGQFGINLLGDPELPLYTENPQTLCPVFDSEIFIGPQTFVVETGVGGVLVCLWKGSEFYTVGESNASGHFQADIEPEFIGSMMVTCTKPNYYPYEGETTVIYSCDECVSSKNRINGSQENYSEYLQDATTSSDPWPVCSQQKPDAVDIWYRIEPGLDQLVTITMNGDELDSGLVVYSGSCGNLTLVDCLNIEYYLEDYTLRFVTDGSAQMDYYIRLYGFNSMAGTLSVEWEEAVPGKFCEYPQPAQCETIFNETNPILGVGDDELPCMSGYQGPHGARWIGMDIPQETSLNIRVDGYDPSDPVGAGFYGECGDLSSPLNSSCGTGYIIFSRDNPSQDPFPLKILVNSPLSGGHPEISLFCMPYH